MMQFNRESLMKKTAYGIMIIPFYIYPIIFLYAQNSKDVLIQDVAISLVICTLVGLFVYTVELFLIKIPETASLLTILIGSIFLNMGYLNDVLVKHLPTLRYWHIAIIVLIIINIITFFLLGVEKVILGRVSKLISLISAFLMIFNIVLAVPGIVARNSAEIKGNTVEINSATSMANLPNIYFLLFDEYASNQALQEFFNYDNTVFINQIEKKNFHVSQSSYNEHPSTQVVGTNLIDFSYTFLNADEPEQIYQATRNQGNLYSIISEHGYTFNGVASDYFCKWWGMPEAESQRVVAKSIDGKSIEEIFWGNTFIAPLIEKNELQAVQEIRALIDRMQNLSQPPNNSVFTFFYIESPHQPFLFDNNGNANLDVDTYNNWSNPQYYTEQLEFISKQILRSVDNIISSDPDSIIVLASDHGARTGPTEIDFASKTRILNAVYYRTTPLEKVEGLSLLNTLRLIFNDTVNSNYTMLEVPNE